MANYVYRSGKRIAVKILDDNVTAKARKPRRERFAYVPLDNDLGYRVMKVAGAGIAGILLHVFYVQRTTGKGDVPITADLLRRCGVSRSQRARMLRRLAQAGVAIVNYPGSRRGSPRLTLLLE